MDKMHEIAGDVAQMPRFGDGMADMAELIRVTAESPVNEIMDAQADGARGSGNRRNGCRGRRLATGVGTVNLGIPRLRAGSCFPGDLIGRCPRGRRRRVGDGDRRRAHQEGQARGAARGHGPHGRRPGAGDALVA